MKFQLSLISVIAFIQLSAVVAGSDAESSKTRVAAAQAKAIEVISQEIDDSNKDFLQAWMETAEGDKPKADDLKDSPIWEERLGQRRALQIFQPQLNRILASAASHSSTNNSQAASLYANQLQQAWVRSSLMATANQSQVTLDRRTWSLKVPARNGQGIGSSLKGGKLKAQASSNKASMDAVPENGVSGDQSPPSSAGNKAAGKGQGEQPISDQLIRQFKTRREAMFQSWSEEFQKSIELGSVFQKIAKNKKFLDPQRDPLESLTKIPDRPTAGSTSFKKRLAAFLRETEQKPMYRQSRKRQTKVLRSEYATSASQYKAHYRENLRKFATELHQDPKIMDLKTQWSKQKELVEQLAAKKDPQLPQARANLKQYHQDYSAAMLKRLEAERPQLESEMRKAHQTVTRGIFDSVALAANDAKVFKKYWVKNLAVFLASSLFAGIFLFVGIQTTISSPAGLEKEDIGE